MYVLEGEKKACVVLGNIFRTRDPKERLSGLCGQTLNCKL